MKVLWQLNPGRGSQKSRGGAKFTLAPPKINLDVCTIVPLSLVPGRCFVCYVLSVPLCVQYEQLV